MDPVFSIIMTSYDCERWVGDAIESVLAQTLEDWELLVIDDGSSDNSWDVITHYHDARIHADRFPTNRGACTAYNAAYALARGYYIASLDCDDCFHPTKLERQKAYLDAHPGIAVCGSHILEIDGDNAPISPEGQRYAPWFNVACDLNDPATWIGQNRLCHSSAVIRKEVHDHIGTFDEELTFTPDWTFWIRALIASATFHVIPEPLTLYRNRGDNNITHRNPSKRRQEYAAFCGRTFHPYLLSISRDDLVTKNIAQCMQQVSSTGEGAAARLQMLQLLLPPTSSPKADQQLERDATIADLLFYEQTRIDELEAARIWLDEQRQHLTSQVEELEAAKRWLDEQRKNWERIATERERDLADLRAWAQEQRSALDWNAEQRTHLEQQLAVAQQALVSASPNASQQAKQSAAPTSMRSRLYRRLVGPRRS